LLDMILNFRGSQISVLDIDWETYQERLEQKNPAFLAALLPQGSRKKEDNDKGIPEVNILSALKSVPPLKRKETLLHHLQFWAARIMGCEDPRQVNVDKPLIEQGVDSLMIVEMRNRFNKGVNITLPMTVLFNYPTLKKVAEYMLTDLLTFPDEPASAGRENSDTATADILQEIEALVKG
jgi:aryl carrier-like protein